MESVDFPLVTSIGQEAFRNCSSLESVDFPLVKTISNDAFNGCRSLESVDFPLAQSVGSSVFTGCQELQTVYIPKNVSSNGGLDGRGFVLIDYGSVANMDWLSSTAKPNFEYLVLRKSNGITTLSNTNKFTDSKFVFGGGKLFVPNSLKTNYSNATNWSALAGISFISLEGSRFESLTWYADYNSSCTLDGVTKKVLDTETADMFKHTEDVAHIYENGTEITGSTLVKDKVLTTTV